MFPGFREKKRSAAKHQRLYGPIKKCSPIQIQYQSLIFESKSAFMLLQHVNRCYSETTNFFLREISPSNDIPTKHISIGLGFLNPMLRLSVLSILSIHKSVSGSGPSLMRNFKTSSFEVETFRYINVCKKWSWLYQWTPGHLVATTTTTTTTHYYNYNSTTTQLQVVNNNGYCLCSVIWVNKSYLI